MSPSLTSAQVHHIADAQAFSNARGAQSIYVDVDVSTWKTRGVMYWDVETSLLVKLRDAGFKVVRNKTEPHALTFSGKYVESKGQAFAINRFGTVLEGTFRVSHHTEGPLFDIHIWETAVPSVRGTPPYLDALHNFLTNPYYHYLGEIIWDEIHGIQDPHKTLIHSLKADSIRLQNTKEADSVMDHSRRPQHSVPLDKNQYVPMAVRRTIDELVTANDSRLVQILEVLVEYPDVNVQVRSIEAFGDFRVTEALPFLENLRQKTQRVEVRSAAHNTMKLLSSFSQ